MSEAQGAEERCGNAHRVDEDDDSNDKSDHDKGDDDGAASASLDELGDKQGDGLEAQLATSGDIGEMLEVIDHDLLDGVDEIAESELLDESPDALGGVIRLRRLAARHCWRDADDVSCCCGHKRNLIWGKGKS